MGELDPPKLNENLSLWYEHHSRHLAEWVKANANYQDTRTTTAEVANAYNVARVLDGMSLLSVKRFSMLIRHVGFEVSRHPVSRKSIIRNFTLKG